MKLTIVYDNTAFEEGLETGWGFSCIIESKGETLLFDTGWRGSILAENLQKLGFDMKKIKIVVLSHQHWDHVGGLPCVMNQGVKFKIYIPASFSKHMKDEIRKKNQVIEISDAVEITEGVYSTGELGSHIKEQSLILETSKGLLVVTGCAHPGLDVILEKASEYGRIYGILGGFHDFSNLQVLENLELIAPCHCTQKKEEIKNLFRDKVVYGGVGYTLEL